MLLPLRCRVKRALERASARNSSYPCDDCCATITSATLHCAQGAPPSESPTLTVSPVATPTRTVVPSASRTRTRSAAQTPATATPTGSSTPITHSRSGTFTPSSTPTQTATPGCLAQSHPTAVLHGSSGVYSSNTAQSPWVLSSAFNNAACNSVIYGGAPLYMPSGNKHLLAIDLGAGTLLNGTLEIDTCVNGLFDTLLFVSGGPSGCPSSVAAWTCAMSNDDFCGRLSVSPRCTVRLLARRM